MRAHAERFGMPSPPKRIIATGGASANNSLLTSVASIFGCNVYKIESSGKTYGLGICSSTKLFLSSIKTYGLGNPSHCFRYFVMKFFYRLGFYGSCIKGCSWLVVQQEGQFCPDFVHVRRQVGEDVSQLQARGACWRRTTYVQVRYIDEEEDGTWE